MNLKLGALSGNVVGFNSYKLELSPTADEKFLISEERKYVTTGWRSYGGSSAESRLHDERNDKSYDGRWSGVGHFFNGLRRQIFRHGWRITLSANSGQRT